MFERKSYISFMYGIAAVIRVNAHGNQVRLGANTWGFDSM